MSALDFPAAPTVGQLFAAPNGVTYQWNGVLWLMVLNTLQKNAFMATIANAAIAAAPSTFVFNSFLFGDASSGYSTSTGRFTPPAGSYWLYAAGYGLFASSPTAWNMTIRKNGVVVAIDVNTTYTGGGTNDVSVGALVQANGTDYFDIFVSANNTGTLVNSYFSAFPISGIQGPPGPPGSPGTQIVAWGSFAPSTSTLLNGFNMAPMVRNGAGDYTINFSSPLPFEYAPSGSFFSAAGTVFGCGFQNPAPTANSLRFRTYTIAGALSDPERIYISCVAGP